MLKIRMLDAEARERNTATGARMPKPSPRLIAAGASLALLLGTGPTLAADLTSCAAGSVCFYVAVQPIDVCSSTGTGCAPFNMLSKTGNPAAATSTTPIGFVDSTSGKDLTRAMLNQIGVDLAWSPIQQYKNTTYQTLHVITCPASGTITLPSGPTNPCKPGTLTSADFLQLSQQYSPNGTYTGIVPIPSNPLGVPVSSQPTVIDMFFVNTLVPPSPGALYGFSWINNNGIAISANTFFPPFPLTPRFDTLAHEIGHNLGLDHADTFNPGPSSTDLMTAGASRLEPASTSAAINDLTPGAPGDGSADQFNTTVMPTQTSRVAISGFLNPIALSTTTASVPSTGDITTALVVSDSAGDLTMVTAAPNSTKPNTSIRFEVVGPAGGRPGETLIGVNLALAKGLHFDPTNPVNSFTNNFVSSTSYDHGNTGDPDCPQPATQCLLIGLLKDALGTGQPGLPQNYILEFTQGIVGAPGQVGSSGKTVTIDDIAKTGASITFKFSDGLIITSALKADCCGRLTTDSQHPDTTVPVQIDPNRFVSIAGQLPCTPDDSGSCAPPSQTNIGDGDPRSDGIPPPPNGG